MSWSPVRALLWAGCALAVVGACAPAASTTTAASTPTTTAAPGGAGSGVSTPAGSPAGQAGPATPAAGPASGAPTPTAGAAATVLPTGTGGPAPGPAATEVNPAGDIPDTQSYVAYRVPGQSVQLRVPEGWSRSTTTLGTTFSDKLNRIGVRVTRVGQAPTAASVGAATSRQLASSVAKYQPGPVSTVQRAGGQAVLSTYTGDSAPDPVTSKVVRDAFERYTFWRAGVEVDLTLAGPSNADNVDPWRIVSNSVRLR